MKSLQYKDVLASVFYFLILLLGFFIKTDFVDMKNSIKQLTESVQTLNIVMAKVVVKQDSDTKRIDKLERFHERP